MGLPPLSWTLVTPGGNRDQRAETGVGHGPGAEFPVTGWSAGVTLIQNHLEKRIDITGTRVRGVRGGEIRTYRDIDRGIRRRPRHDHGRGDLHCRNAARTDGRS